MTLEKEKPKISVLIPAYNNAGTITGTIKSILNQHFGDFELVIRDDTSVDNTVSLIKAIHDDRIKFFLNETNLGCGGNMNACVDAARADILVFIAGDDILEIDALQRIYEAFSLSEEIGIVVRPYYWFEEDFKKPVRITKQFAKTEIVSINSPFDKIRDVIALSDQVSGIGFRKKYLMGRFQNDPFVEIASMVVSMLKTSQAVILKDNIVAIRISFSGSRNPSVYKKSPMLSWRNLINEVFTEEIFKALRKYLIENFVANNYIGLVQIKNYGSWKAFFREVFYLLKYRPLNIINPKFWFFFLGCLITPSVILIPLVDWYKNKVNSKIIGKLKFDCDLK